MINNPRLLATLRIILLQVFVYLLLFLLGIVVYKHFNPSALPGIEWKMSIILIPLGLINLYLWFPRRWIERLIDGLEGQPGRIVLRSMPVVVPVGIIAYVIFMNIFNAEQIYRVDFGGQGDVDITQNAYLIDSTAEGRISGRMSEKDDTYRQILTEKPVYITVNSSIEPKDLKDIELELRFKSDSDLNIATTDLKGNFNWETLYKRDLDDYTLVRRFGDTSIYTKNNRVFRYYADINEWISNNIPRYSNIGLYGYELEEDILINKDVEYKNEVTEIDQTFRGDLSFLVYLKDDINLTLGKQDLNWYNGGDEYLVELYDSGGNLVFSDKIPDDGIIDNSGQIKELQLKSFSTYIPKEGLYTLRLINPKGDQATDSTIKYLRINTNKVVTTGTILPLSPSTLFFNLTEATTLNFNIWHPSALQPVSIEGTRNTIINLDETSLGKWVTVDLPPGEYKLSVNGDIYISGANFALNKDSYFYPYNYNIGGQDASWVITGSYEVSEEDGWTIIKKLFNASDILYAENSIVFSLSKGGDGEVLFDSFKVTLKR